MRAPEQRARIETHASLRTGQRAPACAVWTKRALLVGDGLTVTRILRGRARAFRPCDRGRKPVGRAACAAARGRGGGRGSRRRPTGSSRRRTCARPLCGAGRGWRSAWSRGG
jgi:hypothetical protein